MATVIDGDFEWDDAKAAANVQTHGVMFEEAESALIDPNAYFEVDEGDDEGRKRAIGMSARARVLLVVHVERGERTRIISARPAEKDEEDQYYTGG